VKVATILAVLLALPLAGSSSRPAEAGSIVGRWVSKPTLSQLGEIVHAYEFRPDGSWHGSFDFVHVPIPAVTLDGTYGRTHVAVGGAREQQPMSWTFDGAVLVLREANGDTYRLERR
jgi:hypothetical protein